MIVFLLGIPGCGKSELYRRLIKKLEAENVFSDFPRVDDFPKLWSIFQEDEKTGAWKRCRATEDGGYKVTDDTVWDDILKEVNKDVVEMTNSTSDDTLIFIEFSRPNYVHSILNNFSEEVLNQAAAIYLDVPFETCWSRNVMRHEKAVEAGTDDHLVSREEMEKTYGSDDKDILKDKLPFPVIFIKNDSTEYQDFTKLDIGVNDVFSILKAKKEVL
jgi:adenylate kinase family enzyme